MSYWRPQSVKRPGASWNYPCATAYNSGETVGSRDSSPPRGLLTRPPARHNIVPRPTTNTLLDHSYPGLANCRQMVFCPITSELALSSVHLSGSRVQGQLTPCLLLASCSSSRLSTMSFIIDLIFPRSTPHSFQPSLTHSFHTVQSYCLPVSFILID